MNNKTIIFDFDGTLANTIGAIVEIANQLLEKSGYKKLENKDLKNLKNKKTKEIAKDLDISLFKLPFMVKKAQKELNKKIESLPSFPGIKKTLKNLKRSQYQLGILSNNSKENIQKFLNKHCLDFFDFIYSSKNIFSKNKAMKQLLKAQGLKPLKVIYVGDEISDIEAARKNKVKIISVTWGFNSKKILKKMEPDFLIDKPEGLLEILS